MHSSRRVSIYTKEIMLPLKRIAYIYLYTYVHSDAAQLRKTGQERLWLTSRRTCLAADGGWNTIQPTAAHWPVSAECSHISAEMLR